MTKTTAMRNKTTQRELEERMREDASQPSHKHAFRRDRHRISAALFYEQWSGLTYQTVMRVARKVGIEKQVSR